MQNVSCPGGDQMLNRHACTRIVIRTNIGVLLRTWAVYCHQRRLYMRQVRHHLRMRTGNNSIHLVR